MSPSNAIEPVKASASAVQGPLGHLLHAVGVSSLEEIGWIRVTGSDRVRWLNGMVTNSIQALQPGEGNYNFVLNAQGQIQGDLTAFASDDAVWVQTARDRVPHLMAWFDRYIIMDDVELEDVSANRAGFGIAGPLAAALMERLALPISQIHPPGTLSITPATHEDGHVAEVIAAYAPLVPRLEIWTDPSAAAALHSKLEAVATELGGGWVDLEAIEQLRILEGTPKYGVDIREKNLVQETGQTRAMHFAKGCYLGQEIVERVRSRGSVHRLLTAFRLDGPPAASGTQIAAEGAAIAELTSVTAIALTSGMLQVGLGIARREAVERGVPLFYNTDAGQGNAVPTATPVALPTSSLQTPRGA